MLVITKTADLEAACARLAKLDYVTVDTEFMRESTFWPKLCLIQMAGTGEEMIVDPLADGLDLAPFYALMADTSVVKVFHAARQDVEIVHNQAGIIPKPLFDTQVAAMVCGFGDSISYVNLVKQTTGGNIDKSSRFTDWSRRPLSDKQLHYALGDVTHLREIYLELKQKLEETNRAHWLTEEMKVLTTPTTYVTEPAESWRRLKLRVRNRKGLAILMELAAWRERLAQSQNVPRRRIMRDEALFDIANQAPTETSKLSQLRTLNDGFSRSSRAKDIIVAVKAGLARDISTVPPLKAGKPLSASAAALMDLLRVLLKTCAARHGVATKLIANSEDLEAIAAKKSPDVRAMHGWRHEIFGLYALKLKRGELALSAGDGQVEIIEVAAAEADADANAKPDEPPADC